VRLAAARAMLDSPAIETKEVDMTRAATTAAQAQVPGIERTDLQHTI
jgi:hypothetical protein